MTRALLIFAVLLAFASVPTPNPFPLIALAGFIAMVAGMIHERREERGR